MSQIQNDFNIKSMHIAVYALSLLEGAHKKIHTEDVAQKCLELAPDRFKWEKYKYPDKELVRKALFHASEPKNGALVEGRAGIEQRGKSRDGWQLTPAGASWVRANEQLFRKISNIESVSAPIPRREAERLRKKLRAEPAFLAYAIGKDVSVISQYMFTDLLNCSPDASPETIRKKFQRLLSNAELIGDEEVIGFLRACERQFYNLMKSVSEIGGAS
jgi:hypothetical protein